MAVTIPTFTLTPTGADSSIIRFDMPDTGDSVVITIIKTVGSANPRPVEMSKYLMTAQDVTDLVTFLGQTP